MDVAKAEELTIQKFENRESCEPVTFGTPICLMAPDQLFLSFTAKNEVKIDRNLGYDQFDSSIAKLTKWIIIDAKNPKSTNVVTPFDDVILKQSFGLYLQVTNTTDFAIGTGGGMEATDFSTFRVVKSTIPYLPDWLFKRPHLNHNIITHGGIMAPPSLRGGRIEERTKPLGSFPVEI